MNFMIFTHKHFSFSSFHFAHLRTSKEFNKHDFVDEHSHADRINCGRVFPSFYSLGSQSSFVTIDDLNFEINQIACIERIKAYMYKLFSILFKSAEVQGFVRFEFESFVCGCVSPIWIFSSSISHTVCTLNRMKKVRFILGCDSLQLDSYTIHASNGIVAWMYRMPSAATRESLRMRCIRTTFAATSLHRAHAPEHVKQSHRKALTIFCSHNAYVPEYARAETNDANPIEHIYIPYITEISNSTIPSNTNWAPAKGFVTTNLMRD